jgi:hypothetical protein
VGLSPKNSATLEKENKSKNLMKTNISCRIKELRKIKLIK